MFVTALSTRAGLLLAAISLCGSVRAEPALHSFQSLSVEQASQAAWEAVRDCRKRCYSVAVAVAIPRRCCVIVTPDRTPSKPPSARLGPPTVSASPPRISPECCRKGAFRIRCNIILVRC